MTLTPLTRLEAVNMILTSTGRTPVSTLSAPLPSHVSIADGHLDTAIREMQHFPWYFCTLPDHGLVQDVDGRYPLPTDAVEVDVLEPAWRRENVVVQDGYLYDLDNDTNVFEGTISPLRVRVHLMREFDKLPEQAKVYAARVAARRFAQGFVRDRTQLAGLAADEDQAHGRLSAMDTRQSDVNVRTSDVGQRVLNRRAPRR